MLGNKQDKMKTLLNYPKYIYQAAGRVVKMVERILKLSPLMNRLIAALLISIALHLLLFLFSGSGRGTASNSVSRMITVDLVTSTQKTLTAIDSTSLENSARPVVKTSTLAEPVSDSILPLPAGSRYFLFQEVDKKAEFIYSAPIANSGLLLVPVDSIRVKVRVFINESGAVDSVTVLEVEPATLDSKIFQDALMLSKFAPAEKDGKKVKSQKVLEVKMGAQDDK